MTKYLSVREFAKKAGISEETVRRRCKDNKLPGAYKVSDTAGWQIPEYHLNPSGQVELDFSEVDENSSNRKLSEIKQQSPTSEQIEVMERILSLAFQIGFLQEIPEKIMNRLKPYGIERSLEVILCMRQSKKTITNPEGFVRKALIYDYKPNGLPQKQKPAVQEKLIKQSVSNDNLKDFDSWEYVKQMYSLKED